MLGSQIAGCYDEEVMNSNANPRHRLRPVLRAAIEVASVIFLFYSTLLMGEFTRANGPGKSLLTALYDVFTLTNFAIAMVSACIGYAAFEYLRKQL